MSEVGCADALVAKAKGRCGCEELNLCSKLVVIQKYVSGLLE